MRGLRLIVAFRLLMDCLRWKLFRNEGKLRVSFRMCECIKNCVFAPCLLVALGIRRYGLFEAKNGEGGSRLILSMGFNN